MVPSRRFAKLALGLWRFKWLGSIAAVVLATLIWRDQIAELLERHEKLAGWAQAVGTLLAIYATWEIANHERREHAKRDAERLSVKATALATLLELRVAKVQAYAPRVYACLQSTNFGVNVHTEQEKELALRNAQFPVEFATELLLQIEVLGIKAANDIAQLAFFVEDYNSFVSERLARARSFDGKARSEYIDLTEKKLKAVNQLANESWQTLTLIVEPPPAEPSR